MSENKEECLEIKLLSLLLQAGLGGPVEGLSGSGRAIPAYIVGLPGVAKTQVITQIAAKIAEYTGRSFPCEIIVGPQTLPEMIGGVPVPDYEEKVLNCYPMRVGKVLLKEERGVFVVDEYTSTSQALGGALMTSIQDGVIGDSKFSQAVARALIMNPPGCAVNARSLSAPEANRGVWIEWRLGFEDFRSYMNGGLGLVGHCKLLPLDWEAKFGLKNRNLIVSFLRTHQDLFDIQKQIPKAHDASRPWTSPRSLEMAARVLAICESVGSDQVSDLAYLGLKGCLGEGPADAFVGWFRDMDLPDPEWMLAHPDTAVNQKLMQRPDKLQTALESMCTVACQPHADVVSRWQTAWKIIGPILQNKSDCALYAAHILAANAHQTKKNGKVQPMPPEAAIALELFKKLGLVR
jgi:hypothetical protein